MVFTVAFFRTENGESPVETYIDNLSEPQKNKVFAYIMRLEEVGYELKRPTGDYLGDKTGLYELRPGRHRIVYYFYARRYIVLLHAFLKRTDEIPVSEIKIALRRKEDCESMMRHKQVDLND